MPLDVVASAFLVTIKWDNKKSIVTLTRADIKKPLVIPIAVPVLLIPAKVLAIFQAAGKGDLAVTEKLVEKDPKLVTVTDAGGLTPLILAALSGHATVVKYLLEHKANPNAATKEGRTALHLAAGNGAEECVKCLLAAGASLTAHDYTNHLPVHYVAIANHVNIARLLLTQKTGLNAKDHDGDTPVRCAIKAKQKAMEDYLRGLGGHE